MMTIGEYRAMVDAYLKSPTLNIDMERRMFLETTRGKDRFLAQHDGGRYYEPALESEWQGWLNRARMEKQT